LSVPSLDKKHDRQECLSYQMNDEHPIPPHGPADTDEPALTPLGTTPAPPVRSRRGDIIHTGPELAVAEAEVRSAELGEHVAGTSLWRDAWRRLLKNKLAVFGMVVVVLITAASLTGPSIIQAVTGHAPDYIPGDAELLKSFPPFTAPDGSFSWRHPMGTDKQGRDLLALVLQGGQISLMVGVISTLMSLLIGVSYGAVAGYVGGRTDNIMMRLVDVLYAIPYIILVIVLLSMFKSQTARGQLTLLFVALGAVSWLTMARIVRGQVLSLKNQEFVLAARATGVSTPRIIFRHIVPNTLGPVIVYATLTIPTVMLTEAFLSFLGFGVRPPLASWGNLAAEGIQNIGIFPWQLICPGITMALTLFSFNFLGDGLRDALDPQMRQH
jgi:oligopeptide transport system permease protein